MLNGREKAAMSSNRILTVSTSAQFSAAVKSSRAGDTILVAPGEYGVFVISGVRPTGIVTIKPLDPEAGATFTQLRVVHSNNLTLEGFTVHNPIAPGAGRTSAVQITKSSGIALSGFDIHGSLNDNPHDDAHGLSIAESHRVMVLDSTFQQMHAAIVAARSSGIVIAGNTITEAREGVNMSQINGGLFERNHLSEFRPRAGDHPDFFQVHAAGTARGSQNLIFRDNVMIEREGFTIGGIFIRSENVATGVRHTNITVENNFYEGTYRNAIAVSNADGVRIEGNTVLENQHVGHASAIIIDDISRARIADNIAPLFLDSRRNGLLSDVVWANNVDVVDRRFGGQATAAQLFDRNFGDANVASFEVRAGSLADVQGAGARIGGDWGQLSTPAAAQFSHYAGLMADLPTFAHIV
jgi:hypothetical protein